MVPGLHNKTKQDYNALFSEPQTCSNVQSYIAKLLLHLSGHIVGTFCALKILQATR